MKNCPNFLYRYYRFDEEYTERIFTENKIFFKKPSELNDPFDSKICFHDGTEEERQLFLKKILPKANPELTLQEVNEISVNPSKQKKFLNDLRELTSITRDKLGVYCLTALRDNILMWSHYSDSHKGFCLEFNTQNEFFARAIPITYSNELLLYDIFKQTNLKPDGDKLVEILLTKSKDWEYENEWRIVFTPNDDGHGEYVFPKKSLTGIIFGSRMVNEQKKIIEWCKHRKFMPNFYEARLKEKEYGLDIIPLNNK